MATWTPYSIDLVTGGKAESPRNMPSDDNNDNTTLMQPAKSNVKSSNAMSKRQLGGTISSTPLNALASARLERPRQRNIVGNVGKQPHAGTTNDYSMPIPKRPRRMLDKSFDIVERLSKVSDDPSNGDCLHVSFGPPLIARIQTTPRLRKSFGNDTTVGCILTLSTNRACNHVTIEEYSSFEYLTRLIHSKLLGDEGVDHAVPEAMTQSIYDLICQKSDSMEEILNSCQVLKETKKLSSKSLVGETDLGWWSSSYHHTRELVFLKRLLMPALIKISFADDEIIQYLDFSIADIFLAMNMRGFQSIVIDALLLRTCLLKVQEKAASSKQKGLVLQLLSTINRSQHARGIVDVDAYFRSVECLMDCVPGILSTLRLYGLSTHAANDERLSFRIDEKDDFDGIKSTWHRYMQIGQTSHRSLFEARSSLPIMRAETIAIRAERRMLLAEYEVKKEREDGSKNDSVRLPDMTIILNARDKNGDLILDSKGISLQGFLQVTKFMNQVNYTLPRSFNRGFSRPMLQKLDLSADTFQLLKALFFDDDGSLRRSMSKDIDTSLKHGYINFRNSLCRDERRDERWQVPVKQQRSSVHVVSTRKAVERLLSGVINPDFEMLGDVGLLIGGTEDQSLHHDVARQMVNWISEIHEEESVDHEAVGWEVDRIEYNEAMASPNAPSSLIVGMGNDQKVLLGVQKDQIQRLQDGRCKIIYGNDEVYDIVRENDKLVVIKVDSGCMFTGDLPHAGVRNVAPNTYEDTLLTKLNILMNAALQKFPDERLAQIKAVINVLCTFPELDKLCRLHCSTEMRQGNLTIPGNTIGFSGCEPNTPDRCCLQNDLMIESDDLDKVITLATESTVRTSPIPNITKAGNRHLDFKDCPSLRKPITLMPVYTETSDDVPSDDESYIASDTEDWVPLLCRSNDVTRNRKMFNSVDVTPQSSPPHSLFDTLGKN